MAIVTPGTFSMAALTSEITNDPKALGYGAVATQNPTTTANLLNTRPEPIATNQQEQIYKAYTPTEDLMPAIVLTEYAALTQANRDYLMTLFSAKQVATGNAALRTQIGAVFGAGTTSRTNLTNSASRDASRAEALWGEGTYITPEQVYTALGRS
jgi:hypothetical protein